jgi:hypothetical protein
MASLGVILDLPDDLSGAEIEARSGEDVSAVNLWLGSMERLGLLVFHHALPLEIVDQVYGGSIILPWRRLEGFVREERARTGPESLSEWFQWLVERLVQFEARTHRVPAHVEHRDWQP